MAARKLTEKDKNEIRKLSKEGHKQVALAAIFGVSVQTIYRILNPEYYAKSLARSRKYQKDNKERIQQQRYNSRRDYRLSFNLEADADIIRHLDKQENINNYIRTLISNDIKKSTKTD